MEHPTVLVALVLGIVEGLTEFLPISSTGHLILAGSLLGYTGERAKVFEIVIQAGAILAVCWEYRARLGRVAMQLPQSRDAQRFAVNLAIAFLPAAILGLLFAKAIKQHLFAPVPVALAFIVAPSRRLDGRRALSYAVAYAVLRALVELARGDSYRGLLFDGRVSTSQLLSLALFVGALAALLVRMRPARRALVHRPRDEIKGSRS